MDNAQINSAVVAEYRNAIEADQKYLEALRAPLQRRLLNDAELRSMGLVKMRIARSEAAIAKLQAATR